MVLASGVRLISMLPDVPWGLFGGVGSGEVILILVVLLLVFGPKQLPDLAKSIGNALRGVRKASDDIKEELGMVSEIAKPAARPPARHFKPVAGSTGPESETAATSVTRAAEPAGPTDPSEPASPASPASSASPAEPPRPTGAASPAGTTSAAEPTGAAVPNSEFQIPTSPPPPPEED